MFKVIRRTHSPLLDMHPPGQHSVELHLTHKSDFLTPAKKHQLSAVAFQTPISFPDIHSMFIVLARAILLNFLLLLDLVSLHLKKIYIYLDFFQDSFMLR